MPAEAEILSTLLLNRSTNNINKTGRSLTWKRGEVVGVVVVAASETTRAIQNARMKSGCLPVDLLDLLDRWRSREYAVRVKVYRGL